MRQIAEVVVLLPESITLLWCVLFRFLQRSTRIHVADHGAPLAEHLAAGVAAWLVPLRIEKAPIDLLSIINYFSLFVNNVKIV